MANYMFVLRPAEKRIKTVCPVCAKRGEVLNSCPKCRGTAIRQRSIIQYYVQDKPIHITHIDRNPKNGVLRYWENSSEFFYETVIPELNKYVPEVPYGIHLCHDDWKSAQTECDRINKYLSKGSVNSTDIDTRDEILTNLSILKV
jgi:hypothetical protein